VNGDTREHVEETYRRTLRHLEAILSTRPFLLGDAPTISDFGFFASMFRHFSQDPTPAEIMRIHAPHVHVWVTRMWAAKQTDITATPSKVDLTSENIPIDWIPILKDIGSMYLPYLNANAEAYAAGQTVFNVTLEGIPYTRLPVSRYRVWCLEKLYKSIKVLDTQYEQVVQELLERCNCWDILWQNYPLKKGSEYDLQDIAPMCKGLAVFV
jgi:hypothetical protein